MWDWTIWGALIAGTAAFCGATTLLAVRSLRTWRDLKRLRRKLTRELGHLAEAAELTAEKTAALGDTAEVERSVARLRRSIAQLNVLRGAVDEAQSTFARATVLVPRK
jgi:hypothetical protein